MPTDEERARARQLAAAAAAEGDATGWFETLYEEASAGVSVVPWADLEPNPHLVSWASGMIGDGRRALVVGCGYGDDAAYLAGLGFAVTAFDVSPTAISVAAKRFADERPASLPVSFQPVSFQPVSFRTADLLALPPEWTGVFDLVAESYTVQALYGPPRATAIGNLHLPVAPGGTLLVIAGATKEDNPERDPTLLPWPLTRREIDAAGGPLRLVRIEQYTDDEDPPRLRWRAEFHRD
jgi:SAM-dependent methyltransferase